jgi:hypothetical protein
MNPEKKQRRAAQSKVVRGSNLDSSRYLDCLAGGGLKTGIIFCVLLALFVQVELQFRHFNNRSVPNATHFIAERGYQDVDVFDWVITGFMLPKGAVWFRAPRPLYPAIITLAYRTGMIHVQPAHTPAEQNQQIMKGVHVLQVANRFFAIASMWMLFCLFRRFGSDWISAYIGTAIACSGFGFSFWVAQATPDVYAYFCSAAMCAALLIAYEAKDKRDVSERLRGKASSGIPAEQHGTIMKWAAAGLFTGFLLLGKELYSFVLFAIILFIMGRRWREMAAYLVCCALPVLLWNFYSVHIAHLWDPARYFHEYGYLTWIFEKLLPASLMKKLQLIGENFDHQVIHFLQAFVYIPVLLMFLGMVKRPVTGQATVLVAFFFSFYAMIFGSNFSFPRISFTLWPAVYFFAWRGIEYLAENASQFVAQQPGSRRAPLIVLRSVEILVAILLVFLQNQMLYEAYMYG